VFRNVEESDGHGVDSEDDIHPFAPEEVEKIVASAEDWEQSLITLYFFHGTRARRGTGTNLEQCVRRRWSPYRHPYPWSLSPDQAENNNQPTESPIRSSSEDPTSRSTSAGRAE